MSVQSEYERWLSSPRVSMEDKETLKHLSKEEIDDAFFKDIEFGTAGMRGILGPGTNRMNAFTIRKATIAFARYLHEKFSDAKVRGVVIAHDNRHYSREFTLESAHVLNEMGIRAYIFDSLRPTPELSFAVRKLGACGGIVITASHNPKEYNGYKVYDENGCQLVPYKIQRLLDILASLPSELDVEIPHSEDKEVTITLPSSIDDQYVEQVLSIQLNPQLDKSQYKIVFTPQHGTSYVNAMRIFKEAGYQIIPVEEQCSPDPDFSHTLSPNPEERKAYVRALEVAQEHQADLVLMTDPDADRVGVAYRNAQGDYSYFTGNESGGLLMDYIFQQRKEKGTLPKNAIMFNTIVTSAFGTAIAKSYHVKVESLLTGFKFIGDRIHEYEMNKKANFAFGYEESYGCLIAPFVRDKDGLQALLMLAEMGVYYANQGLTLDQAIENLYQKLGFYYRDIQYSIFFKGASGSRDMKNLMKRLRMLSVNQIAGYKIVRVEDYLKSEAYEKGKIKPILLPKSDVVKLVLEGGSSIAVRPSGTEPKCKFYVGAVGKNKMEVETLPEKLYRDFAKIMEIE